MKYHTSIFAQILSIISRNDFAKDVKDLKAEKSSKGFSCWDQFVGMLFCQLAQAKSLREIYYGLRSCAGKLIHLGIKSAPKRSTLSYANAKRPCQLFEKTFYRLLEKIKAVAPGKKKKFRFKNKLLSLDASVIDLCLSMFPWAKFRQKKGAVKLHLLLDHDGYFPQYVYISNGKTHESNIAKMLQLPAESIVAMDRAYNDYTLYYKWTQNKIWFVTRLKDNAVFNVIEERDVPQRGNILKDQIIEFSSVSSKAKCPIRLRRIVVWDEKKQKEIVLLTNHMTFGATTISAIYKDRWEIEIFFKQLKQNLKIKTFVGTSQNALMTQIWTALIAILLLKYLKFLSQINWAMSNLIALLRWNLFTYRDLWLWLDKPFDTPLFQPDFQQLELTFGQH